MKEKRYNNHACADLNEVHLIEKCISFIFALAVMVLTSNNVYAAELTNENAIIELDNNSNYVIIDTDYASDADDVVAMEIAMAYADRGLIDIKGVALSTTYSCSVPAIKNQLSKGGYSAVPVGMDTVHGVRVPTKYVDAIYNGGSTKQTKIL